MMILTDDDLKEAKKKLRARICDVFEETEFIGVGSVPVSEVLIASAFAWRDWNGGIEDTRHAAKQLHRLVDEEEARRIG